MVGRGHRMRPIFPSKDSSGSCKDASWKILTKDGRAPKDGQIHFPSDTLVFGGITNTK